MPTVNEKQLTGLSSLSEQLDGLQLRESRRLLKQYGQVVLTKLLGEQQDMQRLSLYDDEFRRASDREVGLQMGDTPADDDVRIDSPTTTINQRGMPAWASVVVAGAIGLAGLAGGALLTRPANPVPVVPAEPGPVTIDASSLRATIE